MRRYPPRLPTGSAAPAAAYPGPEAAESADAGSPEPTEQFADTARRKHELVNRLRVEERGLREIAHRLGWGLHTVQRYDRAATCQELADGSTRSSPTSTSTPTRATPASPGPRVRRHDHDLTGQDLPQWMAAAREADLPGIASFAKGPWSRTATPLPTA